MFSREALPALDCVLIISFIVDVVAMAHSCLGVADLLRSVRIRPELIEALPEMWTVCLRVLDDIKVSRHSVFLCWRFFGDGAALVWVSILCMVFCDVKELMFTN